MADGDLLVTISGAALSLLFFENVRSVGDQMGFLLGEVLEYVVKTYTDSDNQVETVKVHINVETIVTCSMPDLLHKSIPRINKEKLKDFVRDKSKQVIGWFHFHRNTNSLTPTLNDKMLHKQFASHFSVANGCKEEFFLTCLLNASTSETRGTHKFRHVFLRRNLGIFEPVSLRINNLGDDASRHDGSDYKPTPVRKSARAPDSFTEMIKLLNLDVARIGGLDSAMRIQKAAEQYLISLIPKVCESDMEVANLEKQVCKLKAKIAAQQLDKRSKVNGENCERTTKMNRENCISEKINLLTKNEIKIGDGGHLQLEHMPSCTQQVNTNSRTSHRNTAAYLTNSLNQDKIRRRGRGTPVESNKQQQSTMDPFVGNSRRFIPEIATESICQEVCEASIGRGRGTGRSNHEFTPGMKNARCTQVQLSSPEQDFLDAESPEVVPPSPPSVNRSYRETTKKTNVDKGNTVASLDI